MSEIFDISIENLGLNSLANEISPNLLSNDNKNVDNVVNDTVDKVSDKVGAVNNKLRSFVQNKKHLSEDELSWWPKYVEQSDNVGRPRGISKEGESILKDTTNHGIFHGSMVNKVHIMRVGQFSPDDSTLSKTVNNISKSFTDLCKNYKGIIQYDPDDFLYCKYVGLPINRLITLRRFPYAVTDNIYDNYNQSHPDIARMVTFFTDEINKLEDILSISFGLRWRELTAEMEQHSMLGDQSGLCGFMKRIMKYIDPVLAQNSLKGENALEFNPTFDQNKVYGPVDSINSTHIRDVGFEFDKEFSLLFEYELRSYSGRTPEFVMRDIIANALAVTYNNAKFWGGARMWVGERPTQYLSTFQGILNPSSVNEFVEKARTGLQSVVAQLSAGNGTSKIQALKNAMSNILKNAMAVGIGKILDSVCRASIITSNSLLSGEPIGNWHLTVGNPDNPIMCIGNLMCTGMEIKFPTDELSYGEFPTKVSFEVRLKPGMAKDRAGIETMFNMGRQRIYHNPKKIKISKQFDKLAPSERTQRVFNDKIDTEKILQTFNESFDYTPLKQVDKDTVEGKNVELIIDGTEYTSNINYDSQLASKFPNEDFKNDSAWLDSYQAKYEAEQNSKYATMNGQLNTVPSNVSGNSNLNVAAANAKANATTATKGTGWCGRKTADILRAGGVPVGGTLQQGAPTGNNATNMGSDLQNFGFAKLPLNTTPQAGDVVVLNAIGKHQYGHIAYYNGTQWISDFKQQNINVWNDIPTESLIGNIYRK
jgi:hypothetical protein